MKKATTSDNPNSSDSKPHPASDPLLSNNSMETSRMLQLMRKMVPPLTCNTYKGQSGRIGVVGGSEELV